MHQPESYGACFSGRHVERVVDGGFCALLGVGHALVAFDDVHVNPVLHERRRIRLIEEALFVGLVLGEEKLWVAITVEDGSTEIGMVRVNGDSVMGRRPGLQRRSRQLRIPRPLVAVPKARQQPK